MAAESIQIAIEGEEADDLYADLISLEVELDDELAALFRLHLAMPQRPDGSWAYLDDARLRAWRQVAISAGLGDAREALLDGVVTHIRPAFTPDPAGCSLEIWGMDRSALMDRAERVKDWPNTKDSDIASELFGRYGLTPEVEETPVVHDEAISTIIQRETDFQFLARLALRNGFECYVEGRNGFFRAPRDDAPPQPTLAAHFGDETTLTSFSLEVNALTPASVALAQVERASKEVVEVVADAGAQAPLGAEGATSLDAPGIEPGRVIGQAVTTGEAELAALGRGLAYRGDWFVTGEGEIAGNDYGHLLRPRRTVAIKGIGETYSGLYRVSHVTHRFTPTGYTQHFRARRNALLPRGDEPFAGGGGLLGGIL